MDQTVNKKAVELEHLSKANVENPEEKEYTFHENTSTKDTPSPSSEKETSFKFDIKRIPPSETE